MGKKSKAKKRKDKFYHLAKETGYRARSAFKLLQLNKKFSFLQTSKVLIDLCAAPGGWLQVASQHMPVSSLILGVDLVPIKPIPNCITFMEDITTESCRSQLKKELHNWKADCVLHDGAPNVGKNWLHDAFSQSVLTLHSLKLGCDFLRKGGWFITKVFRSKDYQALMWIFNQLFKKVHATKPQASRNESAEIFVVCQGYKAPDKIDKKFFDAKHVFEEISPENQVTMSDFDSKNLKKKRKALGYKDDATMLYEENTVSHFLTCDKPLKILKECNQLIFDDESLLKDEFTTEDIVDACKDLKVLGKREFRLLINWHKKFQKRKQKAEDNDEKGCEEEDESDDSEVEIEKKLSEIKEDEARHLKRKKKVVTKERRKLRERMGHMAQSTNTQEDMELFSINNIKSDKQLTKLVEEDSIGVHDIDNDNSEQNLANGTQDGYESDDEVSEIEFEDDDKDADSSEEENDKNPLLVPLEEEDEAAKRQTDLWFSKDIFAGLNLQPSDLPRPQKKKKTAKPDKTPPEDGAVDAVQEKDAKEEKMEADDSDSSSDSDYDVSMASQPEMKDSESFEIVPADFRGSTNTLDAEGLALGTAIATSRKRKRDIIDDSFNRYTFEDDELPDWFVNDEKKRIFRTSFLEKHISQRIKKSYESRGIAINSKTIKKAAEAKARKKRRMVKKMEKVRKQTESIADSQGMSNVEKASQMKAIYKKHGMLKKQKENVTYVFGKKGVGKKVRRPPGVKGKFKVVDRRMKTDLRGKMKGGDKRGGKRGGDKKGGKRGRK